MDDWGNGIYGIPLKIVIVPVDPVVSLSFRILFE